MKRLVSLALLVPASGLIIDGNKGHKGPMSQADKVAVGEALGTAMKAMQGHGGSSKYESCIGLFPDGQPPADPSSGTWLACKGLVASERRASLASVKRASGHKGPMSQADKAAVGEALGTAMKAMQGHGGSSKYESCIGLFPDGQPPADPSSGTWLACKGLVANETPKASLASVKRASGHKGPMSEADKVAVGEALGTAMKAIQGHGGGSKYESCIGLFPDGQPPADPSSGTWQACKDLVGPPISEKRASLASVKQPAEKTYNVPAYHDEFGKEYSTDEYPKEAEGKWHHPDFNKKEETPPPPKSGAASSSVAFALTLIATVQLMY